MDKPAEEEAVEVEVTTYTSSDGAQLHSTLYGGVCLIDFPGTQHVLKEFKQIDVQTDDVYILAYARCGTHWIWEVTSMVANGQAERIRRSKQDGMIEIQHVLDWPMKTLPSPRILSTHLLPKHFYARALNECKYIFIIRNPKDMIVSLYQMRIDMANKPYNGAFAGFLELFLEDKMWSGGYFQYLNLWWEVYQKQKDRFLILTYEDCKKNLSESVRRIAEFLGKEKDTAFYDDVASLCTFEKMKADKGTGFSSFFKPNTVGMYRQGKVGEWRSVLSDAQSKAIDAKLDREIQDEELKALLCKDI